eukprot:CAMPEP_0183744416 /NCGR_PEP_ID=MMETSP0737-20130205/65719_1 /TAXON_ID=385413 /ORGANISM="Thalassiosira miniscula, Strain CCMP1093" /LENGTH=852 /DNA_ID=CAMNT_0025980057 /DNA_START=73 /DNA_END=2631 /DNA_ORIENTATION=-
MTRLTNIRIWFLFSVAVNAQIPCQDDSSCPANSTCLKNEGQCSNPFERGCLRTILGEKYDIRTCSSDDGDGESELGLSCRPNALDYPEIRLLSQNWEEPMFFAWILQIMLSEVANVPVTIETDDKASFYDRTMHWDYAKRSYDYDALRAANEAPQNDCRGVEGPCAHVMSEVWSGQRQAWRDAVEEELIEPVGTNGRIAAYNWYIPKFVADEDPTLVSYYGLSGEKNRRRLAQRFKRPINWMQYCQDISSDQCQTQDETALRAPQDAVEEASYFWGNSDHPTFRGYFKATGENDCDANPTNCTGHIVNYECEQSTFVVQQAHWLNISVTSSGPEANGAGGYGSRFVGQLWQAANATNSSVMVYFADTNPFQLKFKGTPFEFQRVLLPDPTAECLNNRVSQADRCSPDPMDRVGSPMGSCNAEVLSLKKYVVGSLRENTFLQTDANRSPAYDMIRAMEISTLDMLSIMERWQQEQSDERYYGSREAVCHWVANNIDHLKSKMVPPTYPRNLQVQTFYDGPQAALVYVALVLGGTALLAVLTCFGLTWVWKKRKVIVYAQPEFLSLILTGLSMVAISAILHATPPSTGSCIVRTWMTFLGFSMELVPLIVKANAINYLFKQGANRNRVRIEKSMLYKIVAAVIACVIVYLIVWTVVDPSTKQSELSLLDDTQVQASHYCASSSRYWRIISQVFLIVLLLIATVMATQGRNVDAGFNESKEMAAMIYSHFVFMLLRVLFFLFGAEVVKNDWGTVIAGMTSIFLSLDTIICLGKYFFPKFRVAKGQTNPVPGRHIYSLPTAETNPVSGRHSYSLRTGQTNPVSGRQSFSMATSTSNGGASVTSRIDQTSRSEGNTA